MEINNFKNLGKDGAVFTMGFDNILVDGTYKLAMRGYTNKQTDSSSTSNLLTLTGIVKRDETVTASFKYLYAIAGQRIWKIPENNLSSLTNVHTTAETGSNFADVWVDDDNDLYWTSARYIGTYNGTTWDDDTFDLGTSYATASDVHRFIPYDDITFITNGDYLAKIDNDGTDFNASYKQLPQKYLATCGASNGNLVLIGGKKWGRGILLLWNTTDAGWTNKIYFDKEISAIKSYKNGWVFSSGSGLYYTNGYSIEVLDFLPETTALSNVSIKPYSFEVIDDKIVFAGAISPIINIKGGFYVYDIVNKTFSITPNHNNDYYTNSYGIIFKNTTGLGTTQILTSYGYDDATSKYAFSQLLLFSVNYSGDSYYVLPKITFSNKTTISDIKMKISLDKKDYIDYADKTADITIACSDGRDKFWSYLITNTELTNENQIQYDGTVSGYNNVSIGDMVLSLDGVNAGESAFVESIANAGTNTETATLDADFTDNTEDARTLNVLPFRKFATKTVTDTQEIQFFNNSSLGQIDELYILIKVKTTNFPLNIDKLIINAN